MADHECLGTQDASATILFMAGCDLITFLEAESDVATTGGTYFVDYLETLVLVAEVCEAGCSIHMLICGVTCSAP